MQKQLHGASRLLGMVLSLPAPQNPAPRSGRGCLGTKCTPAPKARADTKGSALQLPMV